MAKTPKKDDDERTPAETAKVRDATLRRMLNTPPKPHKPDKGKGAKK